MMRKKISFIHDERKIYNTWVSSSYLWFDMNISLVFIWIWNHSKIFFWLNVNSGSDLQSWHAYVQYKKLSGQVLLSLPIKWDEFKSQPTIRTIKKVQKKVFKEYVYDYGMFVTKWVEKHNSLLAKTVFHSKEVKMERKSCNLISSNLHSRFHSKEYFFHALIRNFRS